MFVPLSDDNALRSIHRQYVTIAIIVATVLLFIAQVAVGMPSVEGNCRSLAGSLALVPSDLFKAGFLLGAARGPCDTVAFPEVLTLVTYAFMHGDAMHLLGNMLFLWVFGDNVEDALGHARFFVFYLLCAVAGALAHAVAANMLSPEDRFVPLVGASGAVAGVIAAYLLLYPHVRVWVLAFRFIPLRITAMFALGLWVVSQFVMVLLPIAGPVAWWAHVGGVVAGGLLVLVLRRPGLPLFNAALPPAGPTR